MMTLRAGQRILSIPSFGVTTSRRAVQSAAADWWAVTGRTTLRAYLPKGAASLAVSYSNLPTPSTGDAQTGTAPDWDATNGWKFTAASQQWLSAQLLNDDAETVMIRFSNAGAGGDYRSGGSLFDVFPNYYGGNSMYQRRGGTVFSNPYTSGTTGISGQQGYKNGVADGAAIGNTTARNWPILIGAVSVNDTVPPIAATQYCTWYVQAWIAIQETLNATEMAALHAVMAAL